MTKQLMDQLVKEAQKAIPLGTISHGVVIDHIDSGKAIQLIQWLYDAACPQAVMTIGLHLPSQRLGSKDVIKMADCQLTREQEALIALLAPTATINIIEDFRVVKKTTPKVSEKIVGIFKCPNNRCITNHEPATTTFEIVHREGKDCLRCSHCERVFPPNQLNSKDHKKESVHV